MSNAYKRGEARPKKWGDYDLDTDYNMHRVAIYRNDEKKKVYVEIYVVDLSPPNLITKSEV